MVAITTTIGSTGRSAPTVLVGSTRRTRLSAIARGALLTLVGHATSLARPIGIAWFAHRYGASVLGGFVLIWACIEIGARFAALGLDRGLQRWDGEHRALAAVSGIAIAGLVGVGLAVALCSIVPRFALDVDAVAPAKLLLLLALPLTAMGNVALRAARGGSQISTYVLSRGVTEPVLFLLGGLVLSPYYAGSIALPAALLISTVGSTAVAALGLVRVFGVHELATSAMRVSEWPVRALLRTSVPLGFADLLQAMQGKLDVIAVAIVTFSTTAVGAYAIAAEVAAVFVVVRTAFDQLVAPFAADARGNRTQLAKLLTTAMRWSVMIGLIIGLGIVAMPGQLLRWFGGTDTAVLVLLVLAAGRAFEMTLAPAVSMLTMVGAPKLSLLDAAVGTSLTTLGLIVVTVLGLGPVAVAMASSAGVIVSSLLGCYWLSQQEGIRPAWAVTARRSLEVVR